MSVVKVTRKFQVTIPECVRRVVGIKVGDRVLVEYDEEADVIKVRLLRPKKRRRFKLGRKLSVEDVERAIGEGLKQCLDNSGR
ncbi:MAG TPA: AbrB/MazE/SpoVT family DNA-binding domain-containing protein [Candidatus Bathyarchaeota archaeon]|nr:AbrB/MazE/SpoVT family DNA-binding domain-containing protein [Candidatus Bathyarchaeota archaeon]